MLNHLRKKLQLNYLTKDTYRFLWKIKILIGFYISRTTYHRTLNKLTQFKDIHKGKRCFIIGNGPSLKASDLDYLKNEITFGSNRVFKIFADTLWRPDYYGISDRTMYRQIYNEIEDIRVNKLFLPLDFRNEKKLGVPLYYFPRVPFYLFRKTPKFGSRISKRMYEGSTITYYLIQFAAYMGFSEIYLLGVDFNYSVKVNKKGNIIKDKEVVDYFYKGKVEDVTLPNLQQNLKAYIAAKKYCDNHSIKIVNASRKTKLEVFDKISFDKLFK